MVVRPTQITIFLLTLTDMIQSPFSRRTMLLILIASSSPATAYEPISGNEPEIDIHQLIVLHQPKVENYWPIGAKRKKMEGTARLKLFVNEGGAVKKTGFIQSSNYQKLDRAAEQMALAYRFRPYLANGVPTRFSTIVQMDFYLTKAEYKTNP